MATFMGHSGYPELIGKLFENYQVWETLQPKDTLSCLAKKGISRGFCHNGPHCFFNSVFKSSGGPKRSFGVIGNGFIKLLKSFGMKHDLLHHSEVFLPKTGEDLFGRNADNLTFTDFLHPAINLGVPGAGITFFSSL